MRVVGFVTPARLASVGLSDVAASYPLPQMPRCRPLPRQPGRPRRSGPMIGLAQ
jgi:hypothetical protein